MVLATKKSKNVIADALFEIKEAVKGQKVPLECFKTVLQDISKIGVECRINENEVFRD